MVDDSDMTEMFLTQRKRQVEISFCGDQSIQRFSSIGAAVSISAPVSPVSSPPEPKMLEKTVNFARSRQGSMRSSCSNTEYI